MGVYVNVNEERRKGKVHSSPAVQISHGENLDTVCVDHWCLFVLHTRRRTLSAATALRTAATGGGLTATGDANVEKDICTKNTEGFD